MRRLFSRRQAFIGLSSFAGLVLGLFIASTSPGFAMMPAGVSLEKVLTEKDGLSHPTVLCIAVSPDNVFLGTERNMTVLRKDGKTTVWSAQNSPLKFQRIPAVVLRGKELWTSCRSPVAGGGTYRWDGLQWEWFEEIKDDMQSNYISCLYVDEKNTLFIGTEEQGINIWVFENNPYRKFGYLATKKGLIDNRVTCMSGRKGELWIGTLTGISVYKGKEGEKELFTNYSTANGLPADHIVSLAVSENAVYAGTTLGLCIFENGAWRHLKKENGLGDNWISALAVDGNALWIATRKGLQRFANGQFEGPIDFKDGLPSMSIRCLNVSPAPDGGSFLYVGTDRGLAIFRRR